MADKVKLSVAVAQGFDQRDSVSDNYDLENIVDQVEALHGLGLIIDKTPRERIRDEVVKQDRNRRSKAADAQLSFDNFSYPSALVLGGGERKPIIGALIQHVLAAEAIEEKSFKDHRASFDKVLARNRMIMPYLANGMTVPEAIEAWRMDNPMPVAAE